MSTTDQDAIESAAGQKDELDKWNWGAFLWGVIWAFGHRLWSKAVIGLVISIVTLGIAQIGVGIWYALKGNRWIWERGGYGSKEELRRKERKWAWAYLWLVLAGFVLSFVFTVLAG